MITFLINLSKEKIAENTMKVYLYPYLKENNLRIIDKNNMEYEDIVNEIKYYMHNNENVKNVAKEFQILIILAIYDEKNKYFGKNLTNSIHEIVEKFEKRLGEENLEPVQIGYLVLDSFERDFKKKAYDINSAISEELNVDGYISSPIITRKDILKLNNIYKKILEENLSKEDIKERLNDELINFFKEKNEKISETEMGKIKDAAVNKHPKKYNEIYKTLKNTLEYEIDKKNIEEINFEKIFIEILKSKEYYYDFLFNTEDINKLKIIWEKNNITPKGEESFNLSDNFVKKIENLINDLDEEIEKIIISKKEALKFVSDSKNSKNCYLNERNLENIRKSFKKDYLDKYLSKIVNTKKLEGTRISTPAEKLKYLLKEYYSLHLGTNNIYRIPFIEKNTLKYNENSINLIYFIMFLIEYGEKKESYIEKGRVLSIENTKYRKIYLENLFYKYTTTLQKEKEEIKRKQDILKSSARIDYYTSPDPAYTVSKEEDISNKKLPEYGIFYNEDDFRDYKENWLKDLNTLFDKYIEESNEKLLSYKNTKNKFKINKLEKEINKNIKEEVKSCQKKLEKANKELRKAEEKVKIDITNEWEDKNEKEVSLKDLESLLEKRPLKYDVFGVSLIIVVCFATCTFTQRADFIFQNFVYLLIIILGIILAITAYSTLKNHRGKICQIINASKRIKNKYIRELREEFHTKKDYIDKQTSYRIAEKNLLLAKKEEKKIEGKIELLGCYNEILDNHCEIISVILGTIKGIKDNSISEKDYEGENFNTKLKELDSEKAPFENDIFNLTNYIEIEEYKKFNILYNSQENEFNPRNIFGCENIEIIEDEIYEKVGREW